MRRPFLFGAAVVAGIVGAFPVRAQDALTLQLKWLPQAQFAGYYVALDLGFYEDEGLDVTIVPGGPGVDPVAVMETGGADIAIEWLPAALAAREAGVPIVNIAQIFQRSGMQLTCRVDTGITSPQDLRGKTVGVWIGGDEFPFLAWMAHLGIPTDGGPDGVTLVGQGADVGLLTRGEADCISTMAYNEYWEVIAAGIPAEQLVIFSYEDEGVATLEDGLYALEAELADPAFVDRAARFLRATLRGWAYAGTHPDEAMAAVLAHNEAGNQTIEYAAETMAAVNALIASPDGLMRPEAFERSVDALLGGFSDPVITRRPVGAWTPVVTDAAGMI